MQEILQISNRVVILTSESRVVTMKAEQNTLKSREGGGRGDGGTILDCVILSSAE